MYKEMKLMDLAKLAYEMKENDVIDFANGNTETVEWYGGWLGIQKIDSFDQQNLQFLIGHWGSECNVRYYAISEWDDHLGSFFESVLPKVVNGRFSEELTDIYIKCIARAIADYLEWYGESVNDVITVDDGITSEIVEVCPNCDHENHIMNWDVEKRGYIAECDECGKKMFLCDACLHADDNPQQTCDWHTETMRGVTFSSCKRGRYKE